MEARRHLEKAVSHISPSQPSYGSRWQPQIDAIRRDIPALRDSMSCLHYAQKEITFDGRPPFPLDMMQIQFREWAVENEFPNLIPTLRQMYDNPLSYPESLGEFNGRTISRIFYCHARIVLAGITYANRPKPILEIGGGYGEIARLWLTNSIAPADSYVIVDIPESLFFAEIALKGEFGDEVGYFEGRDPGTRILLVPIPYLGDLTRSADLVVNTGSMQEMTDEWVDFYIDWLAKYDTRYFYSLNYIAQPIAVMGESRNLWSQRLGAEWRGPDPRLSGGPVRKNACDEKPEGVVDLSRPGAVQADLCRGTRFVATGLHDRQCQNVRRNRDGENAVSSQGAVVHRGVADAARRERIRVAPWQITGRTGRFPLTRACAAESCLTTMLRATCAARWRKDVPSEPMPFPTGLIANSAVLFANDRSRRATRRIVRGMLARISEMKRSRRSTRAYRLRDCGKWCSSTGAWTAIETSVRGAFWSVTGCRQPSAA